MLVMRAMWSSIKPIKKPKLHDFLHITYRDHHTWYNSINSISLFGSVQNRNPLE